MKHESRGLESPFKNVLIPLDDSDPLEPLACATAFGRAGARIELLHVVDQTPAFIAAGDGMSVFDPAPLLEELDKQGQAKLKAAQERFNAAGIETTATLVHDEPVAGILKVAAESSSDLIILQTHGRRGLPRLLLGSVTEGVLRAGNTPVLSVVSRNRMMEPVTFQRLLVAVDESEQAFAAAVFAGRMVRALKSACFFCHVDDTAKIHARDTGRKIIEHARRSAGLPITSSSDHIVEGEPAHGIVESAVVVDADAIVIGSHGRDGLERLFLGSVAEEVIRLSPVPVFVVREALQDAEHVLSSVP